MPVSFSSLLAQTVLCWKSFQAPSSLDAIRLLLSVPSAESISESSAYYTSNPHFAGQGWDQAEWTQEKWKNFGVQDTQIISYNTQIPAPTDQQRLALLRNSEVLYEAPLTDSIGGFFPAFYSYATNTNITAPYVFANFGSDEDYDDLVEKGIDLVGNIAVLKSADASSYLKTLGLGKSREVQVRTAQERGFAGVIIYPDPQNDNPITESNGYAPYPDGPARPANMIERGGIGPLDSYNRGLTPRIPCIPISYADAVPILSALNGYGPSASDLGSRWHGGELAIHGVHYNVGPSPPGLLLNLRTEAYIYPGQVHNVIGKIPGFLSDEIIILGNHRDAWGPGAGDPNSGSAALNEVVRSFGAAITRGWKPYRTIVFASWDGEEVGQLGSFPWIQEHFNWLNATVVAYLNVVVAGAGRNFHVKASPLLYKSALSAMTYVQSPNQTVAGQSVLNVWNNTGTGMIGTAGGGDAIRFQGLLCASTVDFGFSQGLEDSVFPYHSGLDNFNWMSKYGDPEWAYHLTSVRLWLAMTAHLSESLILDMQATDYADALKEWVNSLFENQKWAKFCGPKALHDAVSRFSRVAQRFDRSAASLKVQKQECSPHLRSAIDQTNQGYIQLERAFYHESGLDSRPSFHHVLFEAAPWHTEKPALPGLRRSLELGNWKNAKKWRDIIVAKVLKAADLLEQLDR
ncbi:PA domain-containing protein [Penicillium herquei]|nr:PA domain-containing protein [Penicillium herquei]